MAVELPFTFLREHIGCDTFIPTDRFFISCFSKFSTFTCFRNKLTCNIDFLSTAFIAGTNFNTVVSTYKRPTSIRIPSRENLTTC